MAAIFSQPVIPGLSLLLLAAGARPGPCVAPAPAAQTSPAVPENVAFAASGCAGTGLWTVDGTWHPNLPSSSALAPGLDLADAQWCSGSPFGAEPPPVLGRRGGQLGGTLRYSLRGRPGEIYVLVPSFGSGPTPLSPLVPGSELMAAVNAELWPLARVGALALDGTAQETYTIPGAAVLDTVVLHAQFVGVSPATFVPDRLSNRAAVRLHRSGGVGASVGAEASRLSDHQATALLDGRLLFTGGALLSDFGPSDRLELFDPAKEAFYLAAGRLGQRRFDHRDVRLVDGRVLVTGGFGATGLALTSAELVNPTSGTAQPIAPLLEARARHSATRLSDGRVFLAGGFAAGPALVSSALGLRTSTELYDPQTGQWSPGPTLPRPLALHRATLLPDGTVLLVGGLTQLGVGGSLVPSSTDQVLRFDPVGLVLVPMAPLTVDRLEHGQLLLPDGRVAIAGGLRFSGTLFEALTSTALYDPGGNQWSAGAPLPAAGGASHLVLVQGVPIAGPPFDLGSGFGTLVRGDQQLSAWDATGLSYPAAGSGTVLTAIEDGERALLSGAMLSVQPTTAELVRP
jgi:hypothetical protein